MIVKESTVTNAYIHKVSNKSLAPTSINIAEPLYAYFNLLRIMMEFCLIFPLFILNCVKQRSLRLHFWTMYLAVFSFLFFCNILVQTMNQQIQWTFHFLCGIETAFSIEITEKHTYTYTHSTQTHTTPSK